MDWSEQILRFEPLSAADVPFFASPREMEQAVTIYNRAITNLQNDSQDIAMIALRKLAVSYPHFPQPAYLLGCCLAQQGNIREAGEWIGKAVLTGLPEPMQEQALHSQAQLQIRRTAEPDTQNRRSAPPEQADSPVPAASILERARKRGNVRMASERERREALRRNEYPGQEETHVVMPAEPYEYLRKALPIAAGVLLIAALVLAGIRWLPVIFRGRPDSDAARLVWLVERLEAMADQNEAIQGLLADYQQQFESAATGTTSQSDGSGQTETSAPQPEEPTPAPTLQPTARPTAPPATATPGPQPSPTAAPSPTPDPAVLALQEAAAYYDQALSVLATDLLAGADDLLEARLLLADIPPGTKIADRDIDAISLSNLVESRISDIAVTAANRYRLLAEPEFRQEDYEAARIYYLKAYQLNPRAYGGGVAYYLGRCYQLLDDPETAKGYYEYVIEEFAGRDIARSADFRLREMGYS